MDNNSIQRFKTLLGSFGSGVAIITARSQNGTPAGMTVSSISSVSLDPPLLSVCVDNGAEFNQILEQAEFFALSILSENQEDLSRRFAEPAPGRFDGIETRQGAHGVPLIVPSLAQIICEKWKAVAAGDHTMFLGRVLDGSAHDGRPLIHFRGSYRRTSE